MRRRRLGAVAVIAATIFPFITPAAGSQPIEAERISPTMFFAVTLPTLPPSPTPSPKPAAPIVEHETLADPSVEVLEQPEVEQVAEAVAITPKPVAKPAPANQKAAPAAQSSGHSLRGKASWYCKAGVSVCHYAYGPNTMSAAACAPLRNAMGNWRGKVVSVSSGGRTVSVKLVDYCASTDKTIDLYWIAMNKLGGTGVLNVVVRW